METIADVWLQPVSAPIREILVSLPEEAAAPASESEAGTIYQCEDYEIMVQTLPGGDFRSTVQSLSGFDPDDLTILSTRTQDGPCHSFVWASTGETGDRIGQAVVLESGGYHYCVSLMADASTAKAHREEWKAMFDSLTLR